MQRFRGGLVFKAHRPLVSLNSRLESNKEEEVWGLRDEVDEVVMKRLLRREVPVKVVLSTYAKRNESGPVHFFIFFITIKPRVE